MDSHKHLIDNFKKVCICRSITGGTIMKAIRGGNLSFEALRRNIGVGTGNCGAKRCRHKIEEKVKDYKAGLKAEAVLSENPQDPASASVTLDSRS